MNYSELTLEKIGPQYLNAILVDHGFKLINTGGNCMAMQQFYDYEEDYEVLLTGPEGGEPDNALSMTIGLYGNEHSEALIEFTGDLNECLHFYEWNCREYIAEAQDE